MRQDALLGLAFVPAAVVAGTFIIFFGSDLASFKTDFAVYDINLPATRKACDRAVEALLTSRDPVELRRSGILVHELDCGISRRLPKEP